MIVVDALKGLFERRALMLVLGIGFAFAVCVKLLPQKVIGDALVAVLTMLATFMGLGYARAAVRCLTYQGNPTRDLWASLGAWLLASGLAVVGFCGVFWRLAGQPYFLVNNWVFDGGRLMSVVGLVILVATPNLFGKGVPPRDRVSLGAIFGVAAILLLSLLVAKPDLAGWADTVQPWIDTGATYRDPYGTGSSTPP